MAEPLDELNDTFRAMRQLRRAQRQQSQQSQPTLRPPQFGFEQAYGEAVRDGGGTTIDGRRRNPKERVNAGKYKGMTPGQRDNAFRADYAKSDLASKTAATARAYGLDVRTPFEMAEQANYDRTRSSLLFGDAQTQAPGQGTKGKGGKRRGQASAAPSAPLAPPTRSQQWFEASTGQSMPAAMPAMQSPGATPKPAPIRPKTATRLGYDGTANTPMITADQFRQANAPVTSVAQARSGNYGKSERVAFKPGGETPGMTVVDTAGGGRTVAGAYGTGTSRMATPGDGRGRINGMPTNLALNEPGAGRDITRAMARVDANRPQTPLRPPTPAKSLAQR